MSLATSNPIISNNNSNSSNSNKDNQDSEFIESLIIETNPSMNKTNLKENLSEINKKSRDLKEFENQSTISLIVDHYSQNKDK